MANVNAMTEATALTKWYPAAFPFEFGQMRLGGTPGDLTLMTRCMASRCMSWRWSDSTLTTGFCGACAPGSGGFKSLATMARAPFLPMPFHLR
jgi:hypothetical protein